MSKTMKGWVAEADQHATKVEGYHFPPKYPMPLQKVVVAAWYSFRYLNRSRKSHSRDQALACAEHYAYARVVVCAGGPLFWPLVVALGLYYDLAKWALEKVGQRQLLDTNTDGKGYVTGSSAKQVEAATEGADAGFALHFLAHK